MTIESYTRTGSNPDTNPDDTLRLRWRDWLPSGQQIQKALLVEFRSYEGGDPDSNDVAVGAVTMRQGLGLIFVAGMIAGLLPFVLDWVAAARVGAVTPLQELARTAETQLAQDAGGFETIAAPFWEMALTLTGLPPALFPGWLAAFLSALGEWINWPLRWLTWWIVYGAGVFAVLKALGATPTLQRFFAITSYAALPLILTGLGPLPWIGPLARAVGWVWALAIYVTSVCTLTRMGWGHVLIAVVLPGALVALVSLLALISTATTVMGFI